MSHKRRVIIILIFTYKNQIQIPSIGHRPTYFRSKNHTFELQISSFFENLVYCLIVLIYFGNFVKILPISNLGVYKLKCPKCSGVYIGQSGRNIDTRYLKH